MIITKTYTFKVRYGLYGERPLGKLLQHVCRGKLLGASLDGSVTLFSSACVTKFITSSSEGAEMNKADYIMKWKWTFDFISLIWAAL